MTTITLKQTYASLPRTVRGKPIVINGDPKGENFLYCNGNNIYIRNLNDSSVCDIYAEHSKETTVAKYSPSRFYIASCDVSGKVRVWDTVNPEHILKKEHQPISGAITDIDWTMDNTKLVAVGQGRENFAKAFTMDSGNSAGEMSGHTKSINSVAVKQGRPMRIATASEDFSSVFYEGPPFKFKCSKTDHGNFVNCIRYSPDGSIYISGGSDGKLFMYDGATAELKGELGSPKAHKGGIYAISFNKDGSKLLSVSGDKSAKIWNVGSNTVEAEHTFGNQVTDMQVGCLWQDDLILTVSLSGHINYLDPATAQPKKVIKGHNKPVTTMDISPDGSTFYTGSSDGLMVSWNGATGESEDFKGKGHNNQITDLVLDGDFIVSVGIDDTVRFTNAASGEYGSDSIKLDSQPRAVDSKNGKAVVACINNISIFEAPGRKLSSAPIKPMPWSVSIHPGGSQVAVGSETHVHIFELNGNELNEVRSLPAEDCCAVSYSPDGAFLAASSKNSVMLYDIENDYKDLIGAWGKQHTAKVTSISWAPDGRRFASGGIDSHIIIWEQGKFVGKKPMIKAHAMSHINKLRWLNNNSVLTAGHDSNLKVWTVSD